MNLPQILILLRLLMSPIIVFIGWKFGENGTWAVLILMYIGLFSDIFDGIIARKQNISTEKLRRLDSQIDAIFWISIGVSAWFIYPKLINSNIFYITLIFLTEILCYIISFIKFRKETCTHAFLSKIWGLTLLAAFTSILGFGQTGFPFALTIAMGLISHLDVILIILILPKWQHDIPSSYHAYLIRKGISFKKSKLLNS